MLEMVVLTLAGANIANVQVIQLLFVRRGSTKSHRVAAIQIITTIVLETQTVIITMLGDVLGAMKQPILLNIAIIIILSKIFS